MDLRIAMMMSRTSRKKPATIKNPAARFSSRSPSHHANPKPAKKMINRPNTAAAIPDKTDEPTSVAFCVTLRTESL